MRRFSELYTAGALLTVFLTLQPSLLHAQYAGPGYTNIYRVSQLVPQSHATSGCNPKTGLRTGGSACYDDQAYILPVLASATSAAPVDLIVDVSFATSQCLLLPASPYVVIEGLSSRITGIYVLPASNISLIANNYPGLAAGCQGGTTAGAAPATAGSVIVRNLILNGNRGTYPNGNSTHGDGRCANGCEIVNVANLQYFSLQNVLLYDSPYFSSQSANIDRQEYFHVDADSPSLGTNTDGIHMDGPHGTYTMNGIYCHTGDDCIADNIPEGYGGSGGAGTISNVVLDNALAGFRSYTYAGTGAYIQAPVTIANMSGTVKSTNGNNAGVIRIGWATGAGVADAIQSVSVVNAHVASDALWWDIANNAGALSCTDCMWLNPTAANPFINFLGTATVSSFTCTSCSIYRSTSGNAAAYWGHTNNNSVIKRLELNGVSVQNEQGTAYAALPYAWDVLSGGSIGTVIMHAMDPNLQPAFTNGNQWSRITSFYGAGVSNYYRNTTYANLPPATYTGLSASISDSTTQTWGAAAAGAGSSFSQLASNGASWTVTGK